ncbi:TPA: hypothetical protein RY505_003264 [Escherichia albertii]|nr:hypothetical protein [Escherichia albertii]
MGTVKVRPYLSVFLKHNKTAPPAFIASSLPILEGALGVLRSHFGFIPADINIGTFDEHPMLGFLSNNIWSVRQNEEQWVETAFSVMQRALFEEKSEPRRVIVANDIVVSSTGINSTASPLTNPAT